MSTMDHIPEITEAMRAEAKKHPNGYLYIIDKLYAKDGVDGAVPPEGIQGAFPVDANGEVVPEFRPNPNYRKIDR